MLDSFPEKQDKDVIELMRKRLEIAKQHPDSDYWKAEAQRAENWLERVHE